MSCDTVDPNDEGTRTVVLSERAVELMRTLIEEEERHIRAQMPVIVHAGFRRVMENDLEIIAEIKEQLA